MFLIVFLALLLAAVFYVLLIPIILYVDTAKNQYYIKLGGLVKAIILNDEEEVLKIKFKIFFLNFYFYPLKRWSSSKKKKRIKESNKKRKRRIGIQTGLRMLKSFNLKKILLDIDTGNCISNAKLYPVFGFLMYYTKGNFNINFEGRNRMVLCIQNRPIHLIRSYINI